MRPSIKYPKEKITARLQTAKPQSLDRKKKIKIVKVDGKKRARSNSKKMVRKFGFFGKIPGEENSEISLKKTKQHRIGKSDYDLRMETKPYLDLISSCIFKLYLLTFKNENNPKVSLAKIIETKKKIQEKISGNVRNHEENLKILGKTIDWSHCLLHCTNVMVDFHGYNLNVKNCLELLSVAQRIYSASKHEDQLQEFKFQISEILAKIDFLKILKCFQNSDVDDINYLEYLYKNPHFPKKKVNFRQVMDPSLSLSVKVKRKTHIISKLLGYFKDEFEKTSTISFYKNFKIFSTLCSLLHLNLNNYDDIAEICEVFESKQKEQFGLDLEEFIKLDENGKIDIKKLVTWVTKSREEKISRREQYNMFISLTIYYLSDIYSNFKEDNFELYIQKLNALIMISENFFSYSNNQNTHQKIEIIISNLINSLDDERGRDESKSQSRNEGSSQVEESLRKMKKKRKNFNLVIANTHNHKKNQNFDKDYLNYKTKEESRMDIQRKFYNRMGGKTKTQNSKTLGSDSEMFQNPIYFDGPNESINKSKIRSIRASSLKKSMIKSKSHAKILTTSPKKSILMSLNKNERPPEVPNDYFLGDRYLEKIYNFKGFTGIEYDEEHLKKCYSLQVDDFLPRKEYKKLIKKSRFLYDKPEKEYKWSGTLRGKNNQLNRHDLISKRRLPKGYGAKRNNSCADINEVNFVQRNKNVMGSLIANDKKGFSNSVDRQHGMKQIGETSRTADPFREKSFGMKASFQYRNQEETSGFLTSRQRSNTRRSAKKQIKRPKSARVRRNPSRSFRHKEPEAEMSETNFARAGVFATKDDMRRFERVLVKPKEKTEILYSKQNDYLTLDNNRYDWQNIKYGIERAESMGIYKSNQPHVGKINIDKTFKEKGMGALTERPGDKTIIKKKKKEYHKQLMKELNKGNANKVLIKGDRKQIVEEEIIEGVVYEEKLVTNLDYRMERARRNREKSRQEKMVRRAKYVRVNLEDRIGLAKKRKQEIEMKRKQEIKDKMKKKQNKFKSFRAAVKKNPNEARRNLAASFRVRPREQEEQYYYVERSVSPIPEQLKGRNIFLAERNQNIHKQGYLINMGENNQTRKRNSHASFNYGDNTRRGSSKSYRNSLKGFRSSKTVKEFSMDQGRNEPMTSRGNYKRSGFAKQSRPLSRASSRGRASMASNSENEAEDDQPSPRRHLEYDRNQETSIFGIKSPRKTLRRGKSSHEVDLFSRSRTPKQIYSAKKRSGSRPSLDPPSNPNNFFPTRRSSVHFNPVQIRKNLGEVTPNFTLNPRSIKGDDSQSNGTISEANSIQEYDYQSGGSNQHVSFSKNEAGRMRKKGFPDVRVSMVQRNPTDESEGLQSDKMVLENLAEEDYDEESHDINRSIASKSDYIKSLMDGDSDEFIQNKRRQSRIMSDRSGDLGSSLDLRRSREMKFLEGMSILNSYVDFTLRRALHKMAYFYLPNMSSDKRRGLIYPMTDDNKGTGQNAYEIGKGKSLKNVDLVEKSFPKQKIGTFLSPDSMFAPNDRRRSMFTQPRSAFGNLHSRRAQNNFRLDDPNKTINPLSKPNNVLKTFRRSSTASLRPRQTSLTRLEQSSNISSHFKEVFKSKIRKISFSIDSNLWRDTPQVHYIDVMLTLQDNFLDKEAFFINIKFRNRGNTDSIGKIWIKRKINCKLIWISQIRDPWKMLSKGLDLKFKALKNQSKNITTKEKAVYKSQLLQEKSKRSIMDNIVEEGGDSSLLNPESISGLEDSVRPSSKQSNSQDSYLFNDNNNMDSDNHFAITGFDEMILRKQMINLITSSIQKLRFMLRRHYAIVKDRHGTRFVFRDKEVNSLIKLKFFFHKIFVKRQSEKIKEAMKIKPPSSKLLEKMGVFNYLDKKYEKKHTRELEDWEVNAMELVKMIDVTKVKKVLKKTKKGKRALTYKVKIGNAEANLIDSGGKGQSVSPISMDSMKFRRFRRKETKTRVHYFNPVAERKKKTMQELPSQSPMVLHTSQSSRNEEEGSSSEVSDVSSKILESDREDSVMAISEVESRSVSPPKDPNQRRKAFHLFDDSNAKFPSFAAMQNLKIKTEEDNKDSVGISKKSSMNKSPITPRKRSRKKRKLVTAANSINTIFNPLKNFNVKNITSHLKNTFKAVMKFKKALRKYRGWEEIEIPNQNEIFMINQKLMRLILFYKSNYWILEIYIGTKDESLLLSKKDTDSVLEAFELRFNLWCWNSLRSGKGVGFGYMRRDTNRDIKPEVTKKMWGRRSSVMSGKIVKTNPAKSFEAFSIGVSIGELDSYLGLSRRNIMQYLASKYLGCIYSSKFEKRFIENVSIKMRKEIEAFGLKKRRTMKQDFQRSTTKKYRNSMMKPLSFRPGGRIARSGRIFVEQEMTFSKFSRKASLQSSSIVTDIMKAQEQHKKLRRKKISKHKKSGDMLNIYTETSKVSSDMTSSYISEKSMHEHKVNKIQNEYRSGLQKIIEGKEGDLDMPETGIKIHGKEPIVINKPEEGLHKFNKLDHKARLIFEAIPQMVRKRSYVDLAVKGIAKVFKKLTAVEKKKKAMTHQDIIGERSVYLAQTINYAFMKKDKIKEYIRDTKRPDTITYKIELEHKTECNRQPIINVTINTYDFTGKHSAKYYITELSASEKLIPILMLSDTRLKLLYLKIFFNEKKRNILGKYESHGREKGFIKISNYDSDYRSVYNSLVYSIPNGYIKFLTTRNVFFTANVGKIGLVVVEAEIFDNIEINEKSKFLLVKFKLSKRNSRGNFYLMVATHQDILNVTNTDSLEIYNNERYLIEVLTSYVNKFELTRQSTYKRLVIKAKNLNRYLKHDIHLLNTTLSSQNHKSNVLSKRPSLIYPNMFSTKPKIQYKRKYNANPLVDVFSLMRSPTINIKEQLRKQLRRDSHYINKNQVNIYEEAQIPNFLSEEIRVLDPVFKFVSKIKKEFAITTVYNSKIIKYVILKIYWPRNKRILLAVFHNDEMRKGDVFMDQIIRRRVGIYRTNKALVKLEQSFEDELDLIDPHDTRNFNMSQKSREERLGSMKKTMAHFGQKNAFAQGISGLNNTSTLEQKAIKKRYKQRVQEREKEIALRKVVVKPKTLMRKSTFTTKNSRFSSSQVFGGTNFLNVPATSRNKKRRKSSIKNFSAIAEEVSELSISQKSGESHLDEERIREEYRFHTGKYNDFAHSAILFFDKNLELGNATFSNLKKAALKSILHLKPKSKVGSIIASKQMEVSSKVYKEMEEKIKHFHSLYYWSNLLNLTKIEKRSLQKQVLRIQNSSSIIREEIYSKQCLINKNIIHIEILIENEQKNNSMLSKFGNYKLGNLQGIYMFLKVKNLSLNYEKNDKVNLLKAIELLGSDYYKSSPAINKDVKLSSKSKYSKLTFKDVKKVTVNIKEIRFIAGLIGRKIYQGLAKLFSLDKRQRSYINLDELSGEIRRKSFRRMMTSKENSRFRRTRLKTSTLVKRRNLKNKSSMKQRLKKKTGDKDESRFTPNSNPKSFSGGHATFLESSIKYLINPKRSTYLNFHSRICHNLQLKENENFILLYKAKLIKTPPHVCWLLYNVESKNFMVLIYPMKNQEMSRIELEMNFVKRSLPFVEIAMNQHEYFTVGKRIYKAFKNTILVEYRLMKNFQETAGGIGKKGFKGFKGFTDINSRKFYNVSSDGLRAVIGAGFDETKSLDFSQISQASMLGLEY